MRDELRNFDKKTLIGLFFDSIHLAVLHYGLWFGETEHQIGLDKAITTDDTVWENLLPAAIRRLASRLEIPLEGDIPKKLANLSKEDLIDLLEETAKNWLASDGTWFRAIETGDEHGMYTAKRTNDTNWTRFTYIEARVIMKRLNLPENGGIPSLKEALKYRQNAFLNREEIVDIGDNKIILRINDCRVQSTRKRKNLPDYPCKPGGIIEFERFAEAIDPRIKTKCIGCPPDPHPDEWWCAWEFEMTES